MEHTPHQIEEIKKEFSTRRRRQILFTAPFLAFILLLAVAQDREVGTLVGIPEKVWLPGFLMLVVGLVAFSLYNWRCPSCSSYFGKTWNPRFCPRCGVALRD